MRLKYLKSLSLVACLFSSPAFAAMNWCALPAITPTSMSDYEKIAPVIEAQTGCAREASDSAHESKWVCPDDPATEKVYEGVFVHLSRVPGEGIHLVILSVGMQSLDALRHCGHRNLVDDKKFDAGNAFLRDSIRLSYVGPSLTLTNIGPDSLSLIVSDSYSYSGASEYVKGVWSGVHGITTVSYPTTSVKLAGESAVSSDVYAIVEAFKQRGSSVTAADEIGNSLPSWKLTPPVGLAGVSSVEVTGFVRHLLSAKYVLASTADYERYVGLLDAEYGRSTREPDEGCTSRFWSSGNVSITGSHCPDGTNKLTFYNDVPGDQIDQYVAKQDREKKESKGKAAPSIDRDMF